MFGFLAQFSHSWPTIYFIIHNIGASLGQASAAHPAEN